MPSATIGPPPMKEPPRAFSPETVSKFPQGVQFPQQFAVLTE